jgi:hypothetical protein
LLWSRNHERVHQKLRVVLEFDLGMGLSLNKLGGEVSQIEYCIESISDWLEVALHSLSHSLFYYYYVFFNLKSYFCIA